MRPCAPCELKRLHPDRRRWSKTPVPHRAFRLEVCDYLLAVSTGGVIGNVVKNALKSTAVPTSLAEA